MWLPGRPVRDLMGATASTFESYIQIFCTSAPHITALTCHFLDSGVCDVAALNALTRLTKLELGEWGQGLEWMNLDVVFGISIQQFECCNM